MASRRTSLPSSLDDRIKMTSKSRCVVFCAAPWISFCAPSTGPGEYIIRVGIGADLVVVVGSGKGGGGEEGGRSIGADLVVSGGEGSGGGEEDGCSC